MEVTRDLFLSLYDSKIEMIKRNKSVVNPKTGCDIEGLEDRWKLPEIYF